MENKSEKDIIEANIDYLFQSSEVIISSLQKGLDLINLFNGNIITTEIKLFSTKYNWKKSRKKLIQEA